MAQKGIVVQFRRGRHRIHERHFLLDLGLSSREEASKFNGKKVVWKSPAGKTIEGEIKSAHGNKGLLRAIFERGLPGQAVTTEVEVEGSSGPTSTKNTTEKSEEKPKTEKTTKKKTTKKSTAKSKEGEKE